MTRLLFIVIAGLLNACGVVKAPVAPELVGVAPTVERQQRQHEAIKTQQRETTGDTETEELDFEPMGQDEDLPPLRPVGTR